MTAAPILTFAAAAAFGAVLVALAARLKMPSIALLLIGGIALGPEGLGWINPEALGSGLGAIVALTVAIILFEGGLTLDLAGYRSVRATVARMLTAGVLITWLGAALAVWAVFRLPFPMALLAGSLVIVTGPTVVSPILRRIGVEERIHQVLYWEAVLVDAVGVFVAVLCFEWVTAASGASPLNPLARFAFRIAVGAGFGIAAGLVITYALRRRIVSDEYANVFVLAMALVTFAGSDAVLPESGILSVIIAGVIVRAAGPAQLARLKRFKLELTELGIGVLFVLLAAELRFGAFAALGWRLVLVVAFVLLVLRPLVVAVATAGRGFDARQKLFLSWMAPRGIVAAAMASLFAFELTARGYADAGFLEAFAFAVVGATVFIQGLSAPWVARALHLERAPRRTCAIVADPPLAVALARGLTDAGGLSVAIAPDRYAVAGRDGGDTSLIRVDPLDRDLVEDPRFADVGAVVAVSRNRYLNQLVCERWGEVIAASDCYRWEGARPPGHRRGEAAFRSIWSRLPDPRELSAGIEDGTLAVSAAPPSGADDAGRFGPAFAPLFAVAAGAITVVADSPAAPVGSPASVVVIRRRIAGLGGLVRSADVIGGEVGGLADVVRRLLARAAERVPELPVEELARDCLEREKLIGGGLKIALPHGYHRAVPAPQCHVANVLAGLPPARPGDPPIQLVFLVLSPVGQARAHLEALAALARLTQDADTVAMLARQRRSDALLARICERA